MPSGAKRRKASKKKKENQNQSSNHSDSASTPAHPHGKDDIENDVGEVSSPTLQDHQKLSMEGEGEDIEKDSEVTHPSSEGVEESVAKVEKEIEVEDELGKRHDDGGNRSSCDGGSSGSSGGSSSSSSSDDESHRIKKGQAALNIDSVGSVEVADSLSGKPVEPVCDLPTAEDGDSIVESIPASNSEEITVSSERTELNIAVASHVIESTVNENGKKKKCCCSVKERIPTSEPSINATSQGKEGNAQYIALTAAADHGAQPMKDSVVTQSAAVPSPYPIQKTSWKGCCGLFEVFSASSA